jgi:hypothetical protein
MRRCGPFGRINCVAGPQSSREMRLSGAPGGPSRREGGVSERTARGPMRFAKPSSQWTCTTYSLPVSRRILCKNSGRSLPVGRISIFSPSYELEQDKTWDSCSKHSRSYRLSPTDTNKHDFSHSLGRFRPVGRTEGAARPRRSEIDPLQMLVLSG